MPIGPAFIACLALRKNTFVYIFITIGLSLLVVCSIRTVLRNFVLCLCLYKVLVRSFYHFKCIVMLPRLSVTPNVMVIGRLKSPEFLFRYHLFKVISDECSLILCGIWENDNKLFTTKPSNDVALSQCA